MMGHTYTHIATLICYSQLANGMHSMKQWCVNTSYLVCLINAHHPNLKWQQYSGYSSAVKCLKTGTSSLNHSDLLSKIWLFSYITLKLNFTASRIVTKEWTAKVSYFWRIVLEFIALENDEAQPVQHELAIPSTKL